MSQPQSEPVNVENISYRGPMSEDDYLALVLRIQQAMAIEPFQPDIVDVVKLLSDWRTLTNDNERLREAGLKLAAETATSEALKDAEIERLRKGRA